MMKILLGFLAAMLAVIGAPASAQRADDLVGIWRADVDYGPHLQGRLVVRKSATGFVASIGGERATSRSRGGELRFAFGHEGAFRGHVDGRSLEGFWIRPDNDMQNAGDPGGSGSSYATPVRFDVVSSGMWSGKVEPLTSRFTLWLSIFKTSEGALAAAFRNPQLNSTGGAARFQVSRNGDALLFSVKANDSEINYPATLLRIPERIRIKWPDSGRMLELSRRTGADAAAFFPRPPGSAPYVYHAPPQLADGWRTARASTVGIDEKALEDAVRNIATSDPTVRGPRLMHSILVARRGKLVLDEYFYGFDRLTPHDMRSASKTFASVMLGTAPARAAGLSPDSGIYKVMRPLGPFANPDPRKSQITLAHLLTHTSGLACNDNDDKSPGNEETMQTQKAEPNWWRYTLNLPQRFAPGTRYAYCSGNTNLVGGALTLATHSWLPELFRRTVAEPLQFGEWHWNLMPNGEGYAGGGAFLLPRDLLKVGQLYLNAGVWNGRRIVPAEWVRLSTAPHVEVSPETTGLSEDDFSNFYLRAQDGLAWHLLNTLKADGRTYRTYGATGNGGQLLIVVPDADLAVVFTGGNYSQGGVWLRWAQQIVGDKIIPAIRQP
jgi:CubicO group peptidase (beta-lactamase class C family)